MAQTTDDYNIFFTDTESEESPITSKRGTCYNIFTKTKLKIMQKKLFLARYDINQEILEKINKMEKNQQNLANLVSRLTEEILITKKDIKKIVEVHEISKKEILPNDAFLTSDEFLKFDNIIKDPQNSKILVSILSS